MTSARNVRGYQRNTRRVANATGGSAATLLRFMSSLALGMLLFPLAALGSSRVVQAAPHSIPSVQSSSQSGVSGFYYLLPQGQSGVLVDTHTAIISLEAGGDGVVRANVDATYRLDNNARNPVTVNLRVASSGGEVAPLESIELTAGGAAVALPPGENGGYTGQVTVGADARLSLRLRYRMVLRGDTLTTVHYGARVLQQWNGTMSLRIDLRIPDAIASESWMQLAPSSWTYTDAGAAGMTGLKWLYDGYVPEEPFVFQFVNPGYWGQLRAAQQSASPAAPDSYARLGELYRRLAEDAGAEGDVRERFYAQAVAAYAEGIAAQSDPAAAAGLHVGLAALYRGRVVESSGAQALHYAQLTVDEARLALAALPAEDRRRPELLQWQVDGLRMLLNEARSREAWDQALAILTTLAALPADVVDQVLLEEDRRMVTVQQALQLMEEGDREAALAVAGPEIADAELLPPPHFRSLFASWHVTVTVTLQGTELFAEAWPAAGRSQDALKAVQEVVEFWRTGIRSENAGSYRFAVDTGNRGGNETPVHLSVYIPVDGNSTTLARLLPPNADWAFLRVLLLQMVTGVERRPHLFWQRIRVNQPMDLREARDQWGGVAAGLEQQAATFEAESNAASKADANSISLALQRRIQAANYRQSAQEWKRLSQESWLLYQFVLDDPLLRALNGESTARSWFATPPSPSQVFVYETQVVSAGRLLGFAALSLISISLLAAVLWSLM